LKHLCATFPTRAKWVLVPTHAIGRMIGDRLVLEGTDWANLRFVTPLDIALRMGAPFLVERGINPSDEGLGPALVMRLLLELPAEPSYFRPLANHPAMAEALWATIRELRMAGVRPDALVADAFTSPAKHAELQALYRAYETFLASNARGDIATVYEEAVRHLGWCPIRTEDCRTELPATTWTPLQRQLLDALPGERVTPCLVAVPGAAVPRRLAGAAVQLVAPDEKAPLAETHLFHAGGREAEVEEVFRRILTEGCSLDQVEIACGSDDYAPLVWEKACRYDWPVTLASGLPAALTRPGRALVGFSAWIDSNFAAGVLRRLLQSGDVTLGEVDLSPGQAARVLAKAEAGWGRQTYELSLGRLALRYRTQAEGADLPADERAAETKKAGQAHQLLVWIRALLASVPEGDEPGKNDVKNDVKKDAQIDLQQLVDGATTFVESYAAKSSALDASAAVALVDAIAGLKALGSFRCTVSAAVRFIRERVDGLRVGADRCRPGHLFVSALSQMGYPGRPHLFVVGLEEGRVFPSATEDPVLLDAERRGISPLLRLSSDRIDEAVYAVADRLASTGGARAITLSYSCRDLREFRQTYPSWLLLQAHRTSCGQPHHSYPDLLKAVGAPVSCVPEPEAFALGAAGWWLHGLKRAGASGRDAVLRQYPLLQQGLTAQEQRASAAFTQYDGFVPDAGAFLDPCSREAAVSPTQLEKAAGCPFRHFLERGLGLTPVDEEAGDEDVWLDPATRGSLMHELYATLMRRARDEKRRLSVKADLAWSDAIGREALAGLRTEMPPPSHEVFEREQQDVLNDLTLFVQAEDAADPSRTPMAFEVSFGRSNDGKEALARPEPIVIDLGNGLTFRLAGTIDRIDQVGPSSFEVIDYKTGGYYEPAWEGTFSGGRKLQHALYGLAALELLKQRVKRPSVTKGVYYFPSARGRQERKEIPTVSIAKVTAVLADLRQVIASGLFVQVPDETACKWCDFSAACGTEAPSGAQQKIEGARTLEPYRSLAAHE
jgi:ATP-dependent helicase/nuclease subunit B